jgi:hypothetical protein
LQNPLKGVGLGASISVEPACGKDESSAIVLAGAVSEKTWKIVMRIR